MTDHPDNPQTKSEAEITNDLLRQLLELNKELHLKLDAVNGNLKTLRRRR